MVVGGGQGAPFPGSLADARSSPALSPGDPRMVTYGWSVMLSVVILDSSLLHKWLKGPGSPGTLQFLYLNLPFQGALSPLPSGSTLAMSPAGPEH